MAWITRNKGCDSDWITIWKDNPGVINGKFGTTKPLTYGRYKALHITTFRFLFHFTPRKGSIKQVKGFKIDGL